MPISVAPGRSREDYLEAILMLIHEKGACRITDIATKLNYSMPSVSVGVKKLEDDGLVLRDDWRIILTKEGKEIAEGTLKKHLFFRKLFEAAGIDAEVAEQEACLVEHVISDDSFRKLSKHLHVD